MESEDIFWYTQSQGKERDQKILDRYATIMYHFHSNPERAAEASNREKLAGIYFKDVVLQKDKELRDLVGIILRSKIKI